MFVCFYLILDIVYIKIHVIYAKDYDIVFEGIEEAQKKRIKTQLYKTIFNTEAPICIRATSVPQLSTQ